MLSNHDSKILSCDPLKRRWEREKDKNGIGDLQSWARCSCSHGRDAVWKKWLSTDVRLALSLFFPASFVSAHGPALFLEPRPFPSCGTPRAFSLERSHLAGKECLLRARWWHPEPRQEWPGKAVPALWTHQTSYNVRWLCPAITGGEAAPVSRVGSSYRYWEES